MLGLCTSIWLLFWVSVRGLVVAVLYCAGCICFGVGCCGLRVCCLFCCVGWVLMFEVKLVAGVWFGCGRFALSLLFM